MKLFRLLVSLVRLIGLVGMPIPNMKIGETNSKTGTFQYMAKRIAGLRLLIPVSSGVTYISNNRVVSIQENSTTKEQVAVPSPIQQIGYTIIGWGVLEEALQSGGNGSIAPTPNQYVNGDTVVVLRDINGIYSIDVDPSNVPSAGIGTAYVDGQGRLSSSSAGSNLKTFGSVFTSVPGIQLANQLKTGCTFYQMFTPLAP